MDDNFPLKYFTKKQWESIKKESDKYPTPNLVTDLSIVEQSYKEMKKEFPYAKIYCAVKTNPDKEIMLLLKNLGSNFDTATIYEIDKLLKLGVEPNRISFGNTIKKAKDIKSAYEKGIRLFVTDSYLDIKNISENAPGSNVFFRLSVFPKTKSGWALSFKFGVGKELLKELIIEAKKMGLIPKGISFHVGSQQLDISSWEEPIQIASEIYKEMKEKYSIELDYINLGGGLPGKYIEEIPSLKEYGSKIKSYLTKSFPNGLPKTIVIEPGRGLFANSAVMTTSIVLISKRNKNDEDQWVYVDAGIFTGLMDCLDESSHFPLYCEASGELSKKFIIAGPSCDSLDILYKKFRNPLPKNIKIGDKVYFLHDGAYSLTCSSIDFNGFPPPESHIINSNNI